MAAPSAGVGGRLPPVRTVVDVVEVEVEGYPVRVKTSEARAKAEHDDVVAALDVGDRQGHVIRLRILEDAAAVVDVRRAQHLAEQPLEEEEFLVTGCGRRPARDLPAGLLEGVGRERDHLVVSHPLKLAVAPDLRPVLRAALEMREAVAAGVAEPAVIDREVLA